MAELWNISPIYNCTSGKYTSRLRDVFTATEYCCRQNPPRMMLWKPSLLLTESFMLFKLLYFCYHLVPALFIDLGLKASRIDFSLLKVYRKIFIASKALSFFILNTIDFEHENFMGMLSKMTPEDRIIFNFDVSDVVGRERELTAVGLVGLKKYMLKEDTSEGSAEKNRQRFRFYELADLVVKLLFVALVIIFVWKYISIRFEYPQYPKNVVEL